MVAPRRKSIFWDIWFIEYVAAVGWFEVWKTSENFSKESFKGRGAAKDLSWFVRSFCLWVLNWGLQNLDSSFEKVLILLVGSCCLGELIRGLQNLGTPFGRGFNFVSAKSLFRWADSRFAEPRTSRKGTILFFSLVRKEPKVHQRFANLWTPGTIQSSAGKDFVKLSGGTCQNRFCLQNAGEKALNRCERVTVVQTQDRCFSKKSCFTASSQ